LGAKNVLGLMGSTGERGVMISSMVSRVLPKVVSRVISMASGVAGLGEVILVDEVVTLRLLMLVELD